MNGSGLRPICVKSQGRGTCMDHSKVSFSFKSFVRGLSAVVRGCPRLSGLHWRLSAVVRGMACFLAILLSADVRGWILNVKSYQYGDLVVRGCPRPPGSPTSCGKAVVRGRYGFLLGFDFFLVCQSTATCTFFPRPCFSCSACFCLVTRRSNPAMADSKPITL